MTIPGFTWKDVGAPGEGHGAWLGRLPPSLQLTPAQFDLFWATHPDDFHKVKIFDTVIDVPRWSQTYARDYVFSGTMQRALPTTASLAPLLAWCQTTVDPRLNGMLVNWYDGARGHYIGAHRDDEADLLKGLPIITISYGEWRNFRLRRWKTKEPFIDIVVDDGGVLILPYNTNMAFTHQVPKSTRLTGKRISVTVRAFRDPAP